MGERIDIAIEDGGNVDGWLATPAGTPRGAIVVIQEIFGVTDHIRDVADGYARDGFLALAPAFFDVIEPGIELDYDDAGVKRGLALVNQLGVDRAMAIVDAAGRRLRQESGGAQVKVGAVGFCWGGTIAYLANTRLGMPAVSYYGARTVPFLDEALRAPMMFHFGQEDTSISPDDVQAHREKKPDAELFTYPAGHAFNRAGDAHVYAAGSAGLARERTMALFNRALA